MTVIAIYITILYYANFILFFFQKLLAAYNNERGIFYILYFHLETDLYVVCSVKRFIIYFIFAADRNIFMLIFLNKY